MQSKREQVHAYQFFMHRVISGLVARESDPAELPFRRLGGAALGSVMVAVLVLAGVGIYGLVVGGGATSWRDGTFVIVERETGTRYVYRDERLHPVVNLASAWLLLEQHAEVKLVSAKSLVGVPRGSMLGIAGAPEGLPGPQRLLTGGWTFCSELVPDGTGGQRAESVLGAGVTPEGGTVLDPSSALLVRDDESALSLLWNGHRFAIGDTEPVLRALGSTADRALPVASAWLEALPAGQELNSPDVSNRGRAATALGTVPTDRPVLVGQVIEAPPGTYYLVQVEELRPISPLLKDIILADPDTADAYGNAPPEVVALSTAALADATIAESGPPPGIAPPAERPSLVSPEPGRPWDGACLSYEPGAEAPSINVGGRLDSDRTLATERYSDDGLRLADRVYVPPGWAALVEARSAPDATTGSLHLVTDQGIRYGLPGPEVAAMLGYDANQAVAVPASLLDRLPSGPALDPVAARQPAGAR